MTEQQYLCEGYTNVYIVRDPQYAKPTAIAHKNIRPLLDRLIAKRPSWVFKARRIYDYNAVEMIASTFDVWCDGEMLGDIGVSSTTRTGEVKVDYQYDTHRLQEGRQRGSWTKTTKLDLAVKGILKTFYSKTLGERVTEAHEQVRSKLSSNRTSANHVFQTMARLVDREMTNFVMTNWEELAPRMREAGVNLRDEMPEAYAKWREMENVYHAYTEEYGCVIVLRGSDYAVSTHKGADTETTIKSSEELPAGIRRNLGLLKLSTTGETIPGIGIRINDYTYYVMDGGNND